MLKIILIGLSFASLVGAKAQADDRVPAAPMVNPFAPSTPASAPGLTEDQVNAIVDRAIQRALAEQRAQASPQAYAQAQAQQPQAAYATTLAPQTVQVIVPPNAIRRGLAAAGERLTRLGEPRLRKMTLATTQTILAPASYQAAIATPQR
jgi:hypothetical protein